MTSKPKPRNRQGCKFWQCLLPAPYCMDPRSLALFRILLAVYLGQDLVGRLRNGRASLSWYTSASGTILNADLPPIFYEKDVLYEKNPDSRFYAAWCWRGTPEHQALLMTVHAILIVLYGWGGWKGTTVIPFLLWLSTTSLVCRTPDALFNDLGDVMGHVYLFWSLFLPHLGQGTGRLSELLRLTRRNRQGRPSPVQDNNSTAASSPSPRSIPSPSESMANTGASTLRQRRRSQEETRDTQNASDNNEKDENPSSRLLTDTNEANIVQYHYQPVCGLPALVISMQVVTIYIAIMLGRRREKAWWYPNGEAIYYAMSSLRYTRPIMAKFVQKYFPITRFMTFGAMTSEFAFPVLSFLAPYDQYVYDKERQVYVRTFKSWRYIPALALSFFHLTLWATIRIPALQIVCASIPVVWIPGSFWDDIGWRPTNSNLGNDHPNRLVPGQAQRPPSLKKWLRNVKNLVRTLVLLVAIPAMLVNFGTIMDWLDNGQPWGSGVVGSLSGGMSALFLSQEWRIFKDVPRSTIGVLFTGYYEGAEHEDPRKDILAVFRTNDWTNKTDISYDTYAHWSAKINTNISAQFGHWRLESFLAEPDALQTYKGEYFDSAEWFRFDRLQYFICKWGNSELAKTEGPRRLQELELVVQVVKILSPKRDLRFRRQHDLVFAFSCAEEPVEVEPGKFSYPQSEREKYPPFVSRMLED